MDGPTSENETSRTDDDFTVGKVCIIIAGLCEAQVTFYNTVLFNVNNSSFSQVSCGDLPPFSSVQLELIFAPVKPGDSSCMFEITFEDPASAPVSLRRSLRRAC